MVGGPSRRNSLKPVDAVRNVSIIHLNLDRRRIPARERPLPPLNTASEPMEAEDDGEDAYMHFP